MVSRGDFSRHLAKLDVSHTERAVAFLFYYRETQEFEERSASELAGDLHDEGFPKPNVTRLREGLSKSKYTTRGSQPGLYQLDVRRIGDLETLYGQLLKRRKVSVSKHLIPPEFLI